VATLSDQVGEYPVFGCDRCIVLVPAMKEAADARDASRRLASIAPDSAGEKTVDTGQPFAVTDAALVWDVWLVAQIAEAARAADADPARALPANDPDTLAPSVDR
jgi:hypothetical protein